MNDTTDSKAGPKTRAQDVLGLVLAGLGAFAAVSILQALQGKEAGNLVARPVEGLITIIGAWPGILFSAGFCVLGVSLFLKTEAVPALQRLFGLAGAGLGLALFFGGVAPASGGWVGGLLPATLGSLGGLISGLVVGISLFVASIWVGWLDGRMRLPSKPTMADALGAPQEDDPGGVTAAEALALQPRSETESEKSRRSPADVRPRGIHDPDVRPLDRDEVLRSKELASHRTAQPEGSGGAFSIATPELGAGEDLAVRGESPELPAESALPEPRPFPPPEPPEPPERAGAGRDTLEGATEAGISDSSGPIPTWEEPTDSGGIVPIGEDAIGAEASDERPGSASWEQVGLFDEGSEPPEAAASVAEPELEELGDEEEEELEDLADEDDEEYEYEYEDEEEEEEEEEEETAPAAEDEEEYEEEYEDEEEEEEEEEEPEEVGEYLLTPAQEEVAEEAASEELAQEEAEVVPVTVSEDTLLYAAGCMILEENRVAVSMLQRRFELDFDQACDVLDELQQQGLIGPYIGGRTREILLTPEEWASKASQTV